MIILSKAQIIRLHSQLIAGTGGADGLRDDSLLESAIAAPFQSFGESEAFPSLPQKAARLGYGLIKNHAFADAINASELILCSYFLRLIIYN